MEKTIHREESAVNKQGFPGKTGVSAVVVAAGKGKRMERDYNKQYITLEGRPILAHTLRVFENHEAIDEVVVVVGKGEGPLCRKRVVEPYGLTKVQSIVEGGRERYHSVLNGIRATKEDCDMVVIHDGARPFLKAAMIDQSICAAKAHGCAILGVPVKDTIKIIDGEGFVRETPKREELWMVQTPQTFQKPLILKAHELREGKNLAVTDDAMLVEALGRKVKMVRGDYENIKITTPEDLVLAEGIMKRRKNRD